MTVADTIPGLEQAPTKHARLIAWVEEIAALTTPDRVEWCDGSEEEWDRITRQLVDAGTIDQAQSPRSARTPSTPSQTPPTLRGSRAGRSSARSPRPTPDRRTTGSPRPRCGRRWARQFTGCMRGRTMYVVPFCMGPLGSPISALGVEITDSPYVVISMKIMTRMGKAALDAMGDDGFFVPAVHSVGAPLEPGQADVAVAVQRRRSTSSTSRRAVRSGPTAPGYGGNALLGKKCYALRIASVMARDEGWLAEHMLILKLTSPEGDVRYIAAAFPSACGKTNLAMLQPTLAGLEGRDGRRRHLLDALRRRRPASRDQPGGGVLRCRAGHRRLHEQERDRHPVRELHLHQRRADRRRRRLVGRASPTPRPRTSPTGRAATGRRTPTSRRPTRTRGSPRPLRSARRSPRSGRTRPAFRSTRSCSAADARAACRW